MKTQKEQRDYDIIVIGSGIGGLAFASLMAQMAQKRVLVLERHFKGGGFTHAFTRHGYRWDVGIHYVGDMYEGSQPRALFDFITRGRVKWQQIAGNFDAFDYPDEQFLVSSDEQLYLHQLIERFPHEKHALQRYFQDVHKVSQGIGMEFWRWSAPAWLAGPLKLVTRAVRQFAHMTTQAYMDRTFTDERLKAVLTSQYMDYGLIPCKSSFAIHALVAGSYFRGAWYPIGGGDSIFDSIEPIIQEYGGDCLVNHEVSEILVEGGVARGVRVRVKRGRKVEEQCFYAPLIVSDAGAYTTFDRLLPEQERDELSTVLERFETGVSSTTLYMGLKESPCKLGFSGENHWIFSGYDHNDVQSDALVDGKIQRAFLSFPSLKDPQAIQHTAEVATAFDYQSFERWRQTTWKRRGEDYETFKEQISQALLAFIEERFPGFRALVDYYELSTPLTIEEFTGHRQGAIYGLPATPERFKRELCGAHTPIKGLMLTGTDVCTLGIEGAMMGAALSAGAALGTNGFFTILKTARNYVPEEVPTTPAPPPAKMLLPIG